LQRGATARTADKKQAVHNLAMASIGRTRVMGRPGDKKHQGSATTKDSVEGYGRSVCVCVRLPTSARGSSSSSSVRWMRGGVSEMKFFTMRMQRKWGGGRQSFVFYV